MLKQTRKVVWISGMAMAMNVGYANAAGFGAAQVQSWLGEPLKLNVAVLGTESSPQWYACVKAKIESLDSTVVIVPQINIQRTGRRPSIQLSTHQNINEPVMNVMLEFGCDMSVRRTYQILLDPIAFLPSTDSSAISIDETDARSATQEDKVLPLTQKKRELAAIKARHSTRNIARNSARSAAESGSKKKAAANNVLRLTLLEEPVKELPGVHKLQSSAPQNISFGATPPLKLATSLPEPGFGVGDLSSATQLALIKSLQVEIDALRGDNDRLKLKASTDIQALQSVRTELFSWIKSLGIIVLMCLVAIAWLTWRFMAMRKAQNHASWDALSAEPSYPARVPSSQPKNDGAANAIQHIFKPVKKVVQPINIDPVSSVPRVATVQDEEDLQRLHQLYERHTEMSARETEMAKIRQAEPDVSGESDAFPGPEKKEIAASKVEEISDVMELVGAWMALHKPMEVLKLLEPFDHIEAPESPLPWLCLLDVYNNMNDQEKYEAIGKRIVTLFNAKVTPWEQRSAIGLASLANFPHVVNKILALWDSEEIVPYLESLLVNDREGTRVGFDLSIYRDIERLFVLAKDPLRPRHIDQLRNFKAGAILFAAPPELGEQTSSSKTKSNAANQASPKRDSQYQYGGHYSGFSDDHYLNLNGETTTDFAKELDEMILDEPALLLPVDEMRATPREEQIAPLSMDEQVLFAEVPSAIDNTVKLAVSPMAIKLNLAIAYQDIGDREGAEILLEEVIKDGTPEQVQQAKSMLAMMN